MSTKKSVRNISPAPCPWFYHVEIYKAAEAAGISRDDAATLMGTELACAVADAWAALREIPSGLHHLSRFGHEGATVVLALDRLEAATRGSALRKVKERP